MRRRRKNYRAILEEYQIHTKAGRLKFLVDVVKAYEQAYPVRFRFYLNQFKKLKQVMKPEGYKDAKGRQVWSDNIPTEPFLYIQRWIPNFGSDPDWPGDMEMLKKAWEDFVCTPKRKYLKNSILWKGGLPSGTPQPHGKEPKRATVFPEIRTQLVDEQGRPLVGSEEDAQRDAEGDAGSRTDLCDDHCTRRSDRSQEVPGVCPQDPAD